MSRIWLCLLALAMVPAIAHAKPPLETVKLKVEATELDRDMLLQKLNEHGKGNHLRFVSADKGFQYRIVFDTAQRRNTLLGVMGAGAVNYSGAGVTVYDAKGTDLFHFERANRYTDSGATNAAAKEIIKRLLRLRKLERDQHQR
ncbi:MAG TPA: hypothetical protein VNJ52_00150 [Patescibacteria group bacterium]|nr:hypothetical protein [Patescibacteria group bacterium]